MPARIKHTKKQVSYFVLHLIVFLVVNAILWLITYSGKEGWVYPWPAWVTATWALMVVGHACMIWANYEDRGMDEFNRQINN